SKALGVSTEVLDALPPPVWRDDIGKTHLRISTNNPKAQIWFDQGINYLHGFWYLEAYRAFKWVITIDPDCAMGYWGLAMCQPGFGGDDFSVWQLAITQATQLTEGCASTEKGLIDALNVTAYEDLQSAAGRWRRLAENFPNEPEVVAFAAIMLRQIVQSDEESDFIKQLLERAIARFPDHIGLLHYYVHLMEVRPDFRLAAAAAARMVAVAPNNSHLTHMPGHLFFLEGEYAEAARVFEAARTQEQAYHQAESIPVAIDQNYLHNLHYLSIVYSELGDRDNALAIAKEYASLTLRHPEPKEGADWMLLYEGRILPALVLIRFGEYRAAAKEIAFWLATPAVPLKNEMVREYLSAIQYYSYAMDFALRGDQARAIGYADQLVEHFNRFGQLPVTGPSEEALAAQAYDVMNVMRYELAGWLNNMDATQAFRPDEWQFAETLEAQLPYDEPPRLMYPVAESLARLHLKRGEIHQARTARDRAL
ncbi:MAG: hypothetical protein AAFN92_18115, partial [Bacteroidota bacterium]